MRRAAPPRLSLVPRRRIFFLLLFLLRAFAAAQFLQETLNARLPYEQEEHDGDESQDEAAEDKVEARGLGQWKAPVGKR